MKTALKVAAVIVVLILNHAPAQAGPPHAPKPPRIKHPLVDAGDVSVWDSTVLLDDKGGIYPVGGTGQVNGGFTIAEHSGVQIGIRAVRRYGGPLENSRKGNLGVYLAEAGESGPIPSPDQAAFAGLALWNFDVHLDLTGAEGAYAGTTLEDYDFILTSTITGERLSADAELFWGPGGLDLPNARLLQFSWNPGFINAVLGEPVFDPFKPWVYQFQLTLKPKFNKGVLTTHMFVIVEEP